MWAHWSIGPLVLVCRGGASRWQSTNLARSLWARARIPRPSPIHPSSGRLSRQRSSRTGPLLSHAERAALAWRFAAKRWSIGRTAGRPSVTQASGSHRGRLCRPGAPLEGPHAEFQRIVRVAQSPTRPASDAEVGFRGRCQSKTGARPAARAPIRLSARGRVGVSPQLNGAPSRVRSSPRRPQMRSRSPTSWLRRRLHAGSAAPGEYWVYCGPCSTPRARYAARTPRDRRGGSVSGDPSAKQQPASESGASLQSLGSA